LDCTGGCGLTRPAGPPQGCASCSTHEELATGTGPTPNGLGEITNLGNGSVSRVDPFGNTQSCAGQGCHFTQINGPGGGAVCYGTSGLLGQQRGGPDGQLHRRRLPRRAALPHRRWRHTGRACQAGVGRWGPARATPRSWAGRATEPLLDDRPGPQLHPAHARHRNRQEARRDSRSSARTTRCPR